MRMINRRCFAAAVSLLLLLLQGVQISRRYTIGSRTASVLLLLLPFCVVTAAAVAADQSTAVVAAAGVLWIWIDSGSRLIDYHCCCFAAAAVSLLINPLLLLLLVLLIWNYDEKYRCCC